MEIFSFSENSDKIKSMSRMTPIFKTEQSLFVVRFSLVFLIFSPSVFKMHLQQISFSFFFFSKFSNIKQAITSFFSPKSLLYWTYPLQRNAPAPDSGTLCHGSVPGQTASVLPVNKGDQCSISGVCPEGWAAVECQRIFISLSTLWRFSLFCEF